jgi:hypothetical protein
MVQRLRSNGVQVVGGSNPPCPTKINPNPPHTYAFHPQGAKPLNPRSVPGSAPGNSSALRASRAESSAFLSSEVATTTRRRSACNHRPSRIGRGLAGFPDPR